VLQENRSSIVAGKNRKGAHSFIITISPDSGGHSMVLNSDDCVDQTGMSLDNPDKIALKIKK
jgi:hypothetical protein